LGINGVLILHIASGGLAAKAGLQPTRREGSGRVRLGDIIVAINGNKIDSTIELFLALEKYKVGDIVNISFLRDGKTLQTKVPLEAVQ
jgi:S1-C subfamily serine protease